MRSIAFIISAIPMCGAFLDTARTSSSSFLTLRCHTHDEVASETIVRPVELGRRQVFEQSLTLALGLGSGLTCAPHSSLAATGPNDGNLPDLPSEAVRSYVQYRFPLQTAIDFYVFDLYDTLKDPSDWGSVGELFQSKPTRIEREFTNVMRVVGLSMPPDEAEEMRAAQYDFEKAMAQLSKITLGIRRDLPVELDADIVNKAKAAWDDGRVGLNKLYVSASALLIAFLQC
jgi:hypothetical protein